VIWKDIMSTQVRTYTLKVGKLDAWVRLYENGIRALREREGFETIGTWVARDREQFIWILSHQGDQVDFESADAAYYELPEHNALHLEALEYLAHADSIFVDRTA